MKIKTVNLKGKVKHLGWGGQHKCKSMCKLHPCKCSRRCKSFPKWARILQNDAVTSRAAKAVRWSKHWDGAQHDFCKISELFRIVLNDTDGQKKSWNRCMGLSSGGYLGASGANKSTFVCVAWRPLMSLLFIKKLHQIWKSSRLYRELDFLAAWVWCQFCKPWFQILQTHSRTTKKYI